MSLVDVKNLISDLISFHDVRLAPERGEVVRDVEKNHVSHTVCGRRLGVLAEFGFETVDANQRFLFFFPTLILPPNPHTSSPHSPSLSPSSAHAPPLLGGGHATRTQHAPNTHTIRTQPAHNSYTIRTQFTHNPHTIRTQSAHSPHTIRTHDPHARPIPHSLARSFARKHLTNTYIDPDTHPYTRVDNQSPHPTRPHTHIPCRLPDAPTDTILDPNRTLLLWPAGFFFCTS